jgi:D-beta-D-heptose 7-phosphate kinase/D-beta-D-heptose 1-phosphate adenosyltransferase
MKFLVVGDVMVDETVYGQVDRLSPEAPIPVLQWEQVKRVPGGAGNAAMNLKAILPEASVYLAGYVAHAYEDAFSGISPRFFQSMSQHLMNVKLRYIDMKTGYQLLRVDNEEEIGCQTRTLDPESIRPALLEPNLRGVVISDYGKGAVTRKLARYIIASCRDQGIPSFVDTRRAANDWWQGVTYMTPNASEYTRMANGLAPKEFVQSMGLRGLLITRSQHGMDLHMSNGSAFHRQPTNTDIIDVTGAGDTALAAFVSMMTLNPGDPSEALRIANKLAGEVCMQRGAVTPAYSLKDYGVEYDEEERRSTDTKN